MKLLAIFYTQSGQLGEIVSNFTKPFSDQGHQVDKVRVSPKKDFSFPWTSDRFFDAMPESVLGISLELAPFELKENRYDLIIFAYQPWFLSPSIPATSILLNPAFKNIVKDTPVITLIGARNMWLNSQERVKKMLTEADAKLIGNIVLTDSTSNLISAITILYWMLTGKKDRFLGFFPKPGVSSEDIAKAEFYGEIVLRQMNQKDIHGLQKKLVNEKAVEVKTNLMFIESRAGKLFSIWANTIIKRKNRYFWLILFKYYLIIALFVIAPIVLTIYGLFFKPFLGKSISRKKKYYLGLN